MTKLFTVPRFEKFDKSDSLLELEFYRAQAQRLANDLEKIKDIVNGTDKRRYL